MAMAAKAAAKAAAAAAATAAAAKAAAAAAKAKAAAKAETAKKAEAQAKAAAEAREAKERAAEGAPHVLYAFGAEHAAKVLAPRVAVRSLHAAFLAHAGVQEDVELVERGFEIVLGLAVMLRGRVVLLKVVCREGHQVVRRALVDALLKNDARGQ